MKTKWLLILSLFVLLGGCSSKPDTPKEYLSTNISKEGVKQFALTINVDTKRKSKGERGDRRGSGERRGQKQGTKIDIDQSKVEARMTSIVDRHLSKTNFCELGYEITEQYRREGNWIIRGHCNEQAK